MKMKKTIILGITLSFCIATIGLSYAYFGSLATSNEQHYSTGDFSFTLTEDNGKLTLASSYPLTDQEGSSTNPYIFSLTNTGDAAANYDVLLKRDTQAIADCGCTKQLSDDNIRYKIDNQAPQLLSASTNQIIASGSINAQEKKTFQLRLWLKEDSGNEVLGAHFHGKIQVVFHQ